MPGAEIERINEAIKYFEKHINCLNIEVGSQAARARETVLKALEKLNDYKKIGTR